MTLHLDFQYEVVRTKRERTASVLIQENSVKIVVPNHLSQKRIDELIQKRSAWIRRKLKQSAEIKPAKEKEYVNGESFSYLGRNYRLRIIEDAKSGEVKLRNGYFEVSLPKRVKADRRIETIRSMLSQWYAEYALERLTEKTDRYANILKVRPKSLKVRDYKSRWGSCSSVGDISYNWRIIMAPHAVINYVVVHELCHMIEHNHSPQYWKHVERITPDWKEHRQWLRENGKQLIV